MLRFIHEYQMEMPVPLEKMELNNFYLNITVIYDLFILQRKNLTGI